MLQAGQLLRESEENTPFEDYSIYMYRQSAPEFKSRVKDLEKKLMNPVRKPPYRGNECDNSHFECCVFSLASYQF